MTATVNAIEWNGLSWAGRTDLFDFIDSKSELLASGDVYDRRLSELLYERLHLRGWIQRLTQ